MDDGVGGGGVHASFGIRPGVDPRHEARRRQQHAPTERVRLVGQGLDPRVVQRRPTAVEPVTEGPHLGDGEMGGGIDDGHAMAVSLDVRNEGLRRLPAPIRIGVGAGVGQRDDGDLVDRAERRKGLGEVLGAGRPAVVPARQPHRAGRRERPHQGEHVRHRLVGGHGEPDDGVGIGGLVRRHDEADPTRVGGMRTQTVVHVDPTGADVDGDPQRHLAHDGARFELVGRAPARQEPLRRRPPAALVDDHQPQPTRPEASPSAGAPWPGAVTSTTAPWPTPLACTPRVGSTSAQSPPRTASTVTATLPNAPGHRAIHVAADPGRIRTWACARPHSGPSGPRRGTTTRAM